MQLTIVLSEDAHHVGPLFEVRKKRPLVRPLGKAGIIHRQQTKQATPPWADMKAIAAVYREAKEMTKKTQVLHVVDHIVPKCGKIVCGLHVHWNLRVVPWYVNAAKGAWAWPDMPFEQGELEL